MRRRRFLAVFAAVSSSVALSSPRVVARVDAHSMASRVSIESVCAAIERLHHDVSQIRIVHLSDGIMTRGALTIDELEHYESGLQRATISDSKRIQTIQSFFDGKRIVRDFERDHFDARWELRFVKGSRETTIVSFDAFGNRGAIDTVPVRFHGTPFVRRLARLLPNIVK